MLVNVCRVARKEARLVWVMMFGNSNRTLLCQPLKPLSTESVFSDALVES